MRKIRSVCVYCASSSRVAPAYFEAAQELGQLLARKHIRCVYGAGGQGLMGTLADAVMQEGGEITGVIPQFMYDNGWNHPALKDLIITPDIHSRKQRMAALSDAVIALPGGCGTFEELLEIITWKQLGLYLNNTQHRRILRPIDRNARPGNRRILHAPRTPGHVVCRQNTARGHRYTIFRTRMGRETM